jgi:hypothetical protein
MTTVSVTVEIPDGIHQVSCQTTQGFNAFFLIRPNGMGMALSVCRPPIEADGRGRGPLAVLQQIDFSDCLPRFCAA